MHIVTSSWNEDAAQDTTVKTVKTLKRHLEQDHERKSKMVRFTTLTIYEFSPAHGGSSVPRGEGPPLGMSYVHHCVQTTELTDTNEKHSRLKYFGPNERNAIFKTLSYSSRLVTEFSQDAECIRKSRRETMKEVINECRCSS
ncbi:hypothetical protein THRCLA_21009 [Thraustotheca clavata]|uniref:Uncharacterized protein n=1 Tax=Thraustotheca clavata TaxID=74557 RepID=A0A1W0A113_9STRA|nr:hypothetical protein THRCLA_21009 [Thraustotheca clavata]